jgi:transcriptional regulator with XRE-family HTH domain
MDAIALLRVEASLRGLTGRDLARRAGVHEATVSRVLSGQITSPDSVRRLQRAVHAELFDAGVDPAGGHPDGDHAA